MFCQNCGKENRNDASFCDNCGVALNTKETPQSSSKHDSIIKAKISTKKGELKYASSRDGPILLIIFGLLGLVAYGLGIILIIVGVIWYYNRNASEEKIRNEIKELEAELGEILITTPSQLLQNCDPEEDRKNLIVVGIIFIALLLIISIFVFVK